MTPKEHKRKVINDGLYKISAVLQLCTYNELTQIANMINIVVKGYTTKSVSLRKKD